MQVCTDLPCALRGAERFCEELCEQPGHQSRRDDRRWPGHLEAVTCLAACDKAPMFQVQGPDGIDYHENMTVDRTHGIDRRR